MPRSFTCLTMAIFLWLIFSPAPAGAQSESQWQVWHSETFQVPLSATLKVDLRNESRYQPGGLYYQGEELRLVHALPRGTDLELGWQHAEKKNGSDWQGENFYFGGIILARKLGSFEISDRNRFEYCSFCYDNPSYLRYRNRLTVALPGRLTPYVADEIFYDFSGTITGINRNRFYAGIKGDLGTSVTLDLYMMRQTDAKVRDEGEVLQRFNALGGALQIRF